MDYSCTSSVWAKRNSKASFLLTSVTIMKSMIGVGILGIVIISKENNISQMWWKILEYSPL